MKFEEIIYYERREATLCAKREFILELLQEYGPVPDTIKERLEHETKEAVLDKLHKLAIKAGSMEEFSNKMNNIVNIFGITN